MKSAMNSEKQRETSKGLFLKGKIFISLFVSLFLLLTSYFLLLKSISAEPDCDNPNPGDIDFCLQRIEQELNALKPAQEYNKKELADLRTQISSLEKRISGISNQLGVLEGDIGKREEDLAYAQEIFVEKTKNHYRVPRSDVPRSRRASAAAPPPSCSHDAFRQKAANE